MRKNYLPHYDQRREYESPLNEYRVAMGLTHNELSNLSGVPKTTICGLASGMLSPIHEGGKHKGQPKQAAKKLALALDVSFEDLFPRYFCRIDPQHNFTDEQIQDLVGARPIDGIAHFEDMEYVQRILSHLTPRQEYVTIRRIFEECSLSEIAKDLFVGIERIRQIEAKAIRKLRRYYQVMEG